MTDDQPTWVQEKRRLEADIAGRHRIQTVDEADELVLRLEDAIGSIRFDLDHEASRPDSDPPDEKRSEWRTRAKRALARMHFALSQVQKRRELLERRAQRK
jgi:hypothetical protein